MKVRRRSLGLVILLVATLLATGCIGGGTKDQTVKEFLTEFKAAFGSLDGARIANLIDFPIIIPGEEGEEGSTEVEITKDDFVAHTKDFFNMAKDGGVVLLMEIVASEDPEAEEMEIVEGGNTAVITNAVLHVVLEVDEVTAEALVKELVTVLWNTDEELTAEMLNEMWEDARLDFVDEETNEWIGEYELELPLAELELKRVNKKWKIATDFDFGAPLPL